MIQIIPVLSDNYCYWLVCPETNRAALVDCPEAKPAIEALEKNNWTFCAILDTHHHFDHVGANEVLIGYKNIPVYGSLRDKGKIPGQTQFLKEGDRLHVGKLEGLVLEVPGHTLGHIAYYFESEKALFCGDTLFVGGCGRIFEGNAVQMHSSLQKLLTLPGDTKIYCGHEYTERNLEFAVTLEPSNRALKRKLEEVREKRSRGEPTIPSTLAEEKEYNPFLRVKSPELIAKVQEDLPGTGEDSISLFGAVRTLKDTF